MNRSIQLQENRLKEYCEQENYNIVGVYSDITGGTDFNRPQWAGMMAFIKSGQMGVDLVLATRWDRFSINITNSLVMIEKFRKRGVKVNTIEQPIDVDDVDSLVFLSVYLALPLHENQQNAVRTRDGMRRAKLEGWWMGTAPWGYRCHLTPEGNPTLVPDDNAGLISQIYEDIALGIYSVEDVWRICRESGLVQCSKQTFLKRLRNVAYVGKVDVPGYRNQPGEIVLGKHPAIVPEEIFDRVQRTIESSVAECLQTPPSC